MKIDFEKLQSIAQPETEEERKLREDRLENGLLYKSSTRIAAKIRRELRVKNISEGEFARRLDISEDVCKDYLSGKYDFRLSQLVKIEKVMGLTIIDKNIIPDKKETHI